MKKEVFMLVMILGLSILLGSLHGLFGLSEQNHETFCAISFHFCVYIGAGFFLFPVLLTRGNTLPGNALFIPTGFILALFKPPQLQS